VIALLVKKSLALHFSTLTFWHFLSVQLLNSTNNLAKLKQLLGHSTIKSTEHYLKYTVEDIREEYTEAFRWRM